MKLAILSTVGTSVLGNMEKTASSLGLGSDDQNLLKERPSQWGGTSDERQSRIRNRIVNGDPPLFEAAKKAVADAPQEMSAELNA